MRFVTKKIEHDFLEACGTIRTGQLHLITPEGKSYDFGAGEPQADLHIRDWSVVSSLAARGDIGFGETYCAGLWETSSIERLITVSLLNLKELGGFAYPGFWSGLKFRFVDQMLRSNSVRGASRNIRAHYDVGNDFYKLWLDETMTYSSALFEQDSTDLSGAQTRKYDRILGRLSKGESVLEVGCGWGGFAERAAEEGRRVTGITISPSQKGYAEKRLGRKAEIQLRDYRLTEGKYDNIVSIEMIEAVGLQYWPSYFSTLKARLKEGGRAVVQAITVPDDYFDIYKKGSDYIRHYTFPGGMLLSSAVIAEQARKAGLKVSDSFAFGAHYATTCRTWAERLEAKVPEILQLGYDDSFIRNWRYYLEICAAAFAVGQTDVVQVELSHS